MTTHWISRRLAVALLGTVWLGFGIAPASANCPEPPPAVRNLDVPRFYGDAIGSVVDADKLAANKDAVAPLVEFVGGVAKMADRSWLRETASMRPADARCALAWMTKWARGAAYLGRMANPQAEYQRKWDLAGIAIAYLKVKRYASEEDRRAIEPWLDAFALRARAFFDDRGRKRNNHWYWLGVALGATSLATGNERWWGAAREIMADAAQDISRDGTLPLEMERGKRALHYHAFATQALVALAEIGRAKGEDFYKLERGALHRLVSVTARGLLSPKYFDRLTTETQERPVKPGAGWAQIYADRFPDRIASEIAEVMAMQKPAHRWLGGDVTVLMQVVDGFAQGAAKARGVKPEPVRPQLLPTLR